MARDLVTLYNLALSSVGTRAKVSLPTEKSREAEICNLWYETVRDKVLRAAPWASARGAANLAVVAERDFNVVWQSTMPQPPWRFMYSLPADFLYPRYITSFEHFILSDYNNSPVLLTNEEATTLIYTKKQSIPSAWDSDLFHALVEALAAQIAMPLHAKSSRAQLALQNANNAIIMARVQTANENQIDYDSTPDWLIARGVGLTNFVSRFVYENGPLLSLNFNDA